MPETKRPIRVFLCHASQDKPAVRELYQRLKREGWIDPWLDEEKILPGQDWDLEIRKAIRDADVILVVLSHKSITKEGYVQKEIKRALDIADEKPEGTIYIIPVRLEECDPPERLQRWHWVDLFDTNGYNRLLVSLQKRANTLNLEIVPERKTWFEHSFKYFGERKETIFGALGILIALLALLLGGNVYEQITGHVIFATKPLPIADLTATFALTSQPITPLQTLETVQSNKNPTNTITPTISFILTETATPKPIPTRTITLTPSPTSTFTPTPIIRSDVYTTMVLIPKGVFQWKDGQKNVPAFYIDQHEVTNSQYKQCVEEAACLPLFPPDNEDYPYVQHYSNNMIEQGYEDYPVVLASWNMAKNYCEWRGRKTGTSTRLPYDYEWEKAARGSLVSQPYPWGSSAPSCNEGNLNGANFSECSPNIGGKIKGDAYPVMSFAPNRYGVYDMSGNVSEWINYFRSTSSGDERMIMGGSWLDNANGIQVDSTILNVLNKPGEAFLNVGFRCVLTP